MTALTAAQMALIADREFCMADFGNFVESTLPDRERIGPTETVLVALAQALTAAEQQVAELRGERADLGAQLYAQTERVQHLLTTIDVERTGRKEAEDEVARLRGAIDRLLAAGRDTRGGQAVTGPATEFGCECEWCRAYTALARAALHAQDTEVGR